MSDNRIEIDPFEYIEFFMSKAALLVTMDKENNANVMALLWKTIGELWMIPIITIAVAPSRYSYELLTMGVNEFTINIPSEKIAHTINITGSYSGRDSDKFQKTELETIRAKRIRVPIIKNCILNYECRIVHSCKSGKMASHSLFFGEVLAAYASKEIVQ